MRQASWNEIFAARREPFAIAPDVPAEPTGWRRFFWWEDAVTFGLLAVIMLSVVASIQAAGWVDHMPPLYPIALLGLLMGALFSRVRWPEGFIHLIALPVGAAGILGQLIGIMSGATPWDRYEQLHERMGAWFNIAFTGGISNDDLPFILLVVSLCWLTSYWSSWAVFRWRNAWLALLPAGGALTANFAFQTAQFSYAFVIFLLGGALLLTRLHLMERSRSWRKEQTPYPPMLSLSVMHATFWTALVLLGLAWLMPRADHSTTLDGTWDRATAPIEERMERVSRLFVSVDAKKPVRIHNFNNFLPFLGSIDLPDAPAFEIVGGPLDQPGYLRAQAYYLYTPAGWQEGLSNQSQLAEGETPGAYGELTDRTDVSIQVINRSDRDNTIMTLGQPVNADVPSRFEWWSSREDVNAIKSRRNLDDGSRYESTGSVSVATEESLRAAGMSYPSWVYERYLQLPDEFPQSVQRLAAEIAGAEPTAYDQALAIEAYLRTIPYDEDVPKPYPGRDAIEYFLFETQRGYFDYHASAMVVMLRSQGVPARLAVGYIIEPSGAEGEVFRYQVSEQDAYAWPEVYFPNLGWVEFNPTPNLPRVKRPGGAQAGPGASGETNIVPPNVLGFLEDLGSFPPEAGSDGATPQASTNSSSRPTQWILIGIAAGLAALVVSGAGALSYAWLRGLRSLEPPARLWEQTVRLASWARLPALGSATPREYARTLREQTGAEEIDTLRDAYVRYRFGGQRIGAAEAVRLEQAWRSVRGALVRRLWPL